MRLGRHLGTFGFLVIVAAACNLNFGEDPPAPCDEMTKGGVWADLNLKLYLDYIEDCPWSGVSEGDTLIVAGSIEDLDFDPNSSSGFKAWTAYLDIYQKIDDESCLSSFWGSWIGGGEEDFWTVGTYPNEKWMAGVQVQYEAMQGDDSGECSEFSVFSTLGTAWVKTEIKYD